MTLFSVALKTFLLDSRLVGLRVPGETGSLLDLEDNDAAEGTQSEVVWGGGGGPDDDAGTSEELVVPCSVSCQKHPKMKCQEFSNDYMYVNDLVDKEEAINYEEHDLAVWPLIEWWKVLFGQQLQQKYEVVPGGDPKDVGTVKELKLHNQLPGNKRYFKYLNQTCYMYVNVATTSGTWFWSSIYWLLNVEVLRWSQKV